MVFDSGFLLAAFVFWAPVSLLLALLTGAMLGRFRDDEFPIAGALFTIDAAGGNAIGSEPGASS
jgi:hypothetical protein